MYHPRFKGSHYEMGKKFGNIVKKGNTQFPIHLDDFQLNHGIESGRLLENYFPEAFEEIQGIIDVLEIKKQNFVAWMMCMGCCLYNLNENNFEIRGCTAFSFVEGNTVIYGRDNDLPPFLRRISKSILYQPNTGNRFLLNTSSFINGEEGINSFGLVAAMTFVLPKINEIKPGLNSVFLVRYILEKCKSIDEAIIALKKLPISSSCNIMLVDLNGRMIVVECTPFEVRIREPEENDNGRKFIITVNHFTTEEMRKYDASKGDGDYFSKIRYETAYEALMRKNDDDKIRYSQNILNGKYGFMCQYDKSLNFETVWSSIFDLQNGNIYCAEGNPQKSKYRRDERYIKHIKNAPNSC